ncbi:two-component system, cell cycle sensor histidine kinase PleC [Azospirillaceae bacterium]
MSHDRSPIDMGPNDTERPKILVVDDTYANLVALKALLVRIDVVLIAASSGNEALSLTLDHEFALILLDVNMPGISGFEVARLLRDHPNTREMPIIFLTATYKDNAHRVQGYGVGAVDYIEKPIDEKILLSKIQIFLDLYRTKKNLCRMANRLSEQNQRLELILASIADGVCGVNADGRITFANAAMGQLARRSTDDLIGRQAYAIFHAEELENLAAGDGGLWRFEKSPIYAACRLGKTMAVRDNILRLPDGEAIPIDYTAAPMVSEKRDAGCVLVIRNATERKEFEAGIERSRRLAEEANRAKSSFLAIMSHELRTPLNTILGFSEIIRDETLGAWQTGRYSEYAGDIHSAGSHLLALINDILDLSKIEAGRMEIAPEMIEIKHVIAGVVRIMREKIAAHKLDLTVSLSDASLLAWADERALKQILVNLLSNAIKFTPNSGKITIVANQTDDGGVKISVSDTGQGISVEKLKRLFRPFEQGDNRYSRETDGTGLGLSLSKGLAEIHGGAVAINSKVGAGTTIAVTLPSKPKEK